MPDRLPKEFVCQVLKHAGSPLLQGAADKAVPANARIRARVQVAPASTTT
jgi:hypothetical protein